MIKGENFIGKSRSSESKDVLFAPHPAANSQHPEKFYIATESEINRAMELAEQAFSTFKNTSGSDRATFLDSVAEEILELGDNLIQRAMAETGLDSGRLEGERTRTVNQLKMFSALLREGSWVDARIDITNADIRTMSRPLGPVIVFGASNFPFAFSTAGGDTASALAAGCPVIVKAHESHPGTNEMVAGAILNAAKNTGMPDGVFSSLNGGAGVGSALVSHPMAKAVGFTGSYGAGRAIMKLAIERDEPIPVYAEMGSVNPVFLLKDVLRQRAADLAEEYATSVTMGGGQFCTNPGLIIAETGAGLSTFRDTLADLLSSEASGCMLNERIAQSYRERRQTVFSQKGVTVLAGSNSENGTSGSPAMATVSASEFLSNPELHEEVFGPFTLLVECADKSEMEKVANRLTGQLTLSLIGTDAELLDATSLLSVCREKAGRILFKGVPTGVEVNHSMMHGGPWPASSDSKFTSVGATAIRRFVRPVAYQSCPVSLLPDELKPDNPLGISRIVNGVRQG